MSSTIDRFNQASAFAARHFAAGLISMQEIEAISGTQRQLSDYQQLLQAFDALEQNDWMSQARRLRHQQMLRIAYRDFAGLSSLDQCLLEISDLAQAFVEAAQRYASAQMVLRYGEIFDENGELAPLLIIGMGKLGGRELNFSSDIDLIFFHDANGQSNAKKPLDAQSYMIKLGQLVVRLLSEPTADGRIYDVDMRLRPFGRSGPLAMPIDAAANYYQTHGREWERYAMQKARMLCGREQDWKAIQDWLRPFVYRRYLDYGIIDALRGLKLQIREGCPDASNIKLGPGGIRSAEFLVQSIQLVRGGREPNLQCSSFIEALNQINTLGLFEKNTCEQILSAYCLLRKVENCLQMQQDQSNHSLPTDAQAQAVVANWLGYSDWGALDKELQQQRQQLEAHFQAQFQLEDADAVDTGAQAFDAVWQGGIEVEIFVAALRAQQIEIDTDFAKVLLHYREGMSYRSHSDTAQRRIDQSVLQLLRRSPNHTRLRHSLFDFIRHLGGRSGYLQALLDNPAAFDRMSAIFSRSALIADLVTRSPLVIDELINPDDTLADNFDDTLEQLSQALELNDLDIDEAMDAIRARQQIQTMRIALLDIDQKLNIDAVSDRLSWTAEALFGVAMQRVQHEFETKHGGLQGGALLWVAYGKLGGYELAYGSDLDIVALRDSGQTQSSGPRALDFVSWHIRLAQRLINFCNAPTMLGRLYEIDMRLRPDGESGPLVATIERFEDYLGRNAWTWELQALVRARAICGPESLRQRFAQIRLNVLSQPRDIAELSSEVIAMREKMRQALDKSNGERFDLKHAQGAIVDIEFMVQFLVLGYCHQYPQLAQHSDNYQILEIAAECGLISNQHAQQLEHAYWHYRARTHQQAMLGHDAQVAHDPALSSHAEAVKQVWEMLLQA